MVRGEEPQDLFRAVKGAFHDLVSSSCTSGKNGTGGGRWKPARPPPPPRNHSSNLEGSGRGGGFHTSPTFSAARESIAVISGSGSNSATTPEVGNAAESSSPERGGSPSDAAIDIWSSGEALKETGGVPHLVEAPVRANGTPAGCGVLEGWGTPLGEALAVILRSPLTPPDAVPPRVPGRTADRGRGRGTLPCLTQRSLLAQLRDGHVPTRRTWTSTKASSACWMPRHVRQRSWPSWGTRDRPHPETHGW